MLKNKWEEKMKAIISLSHLNKILHTGVTPPDDVIYILNHIIDFSEEHWYGEYFQYRDIHPMLRGVLETAKNDGRLFHASEDLFGVAFYRKTLSNFGINLPTERSPAGEGYILRVISLLESSGWTVFDSQSYNVSTYESWVKV